MNWAEPYSVELTRNAVPLTCADKPVVALTPLMAVAIWDDGGSGSEGQLGAAEIAGDLQGHGVAADVTALIGQGRRFRRGSTTWTATATVPPEGTTALLICRFVTADPTPLVA